MIANLRPDEAGLFDLGDSAYAVATIESPREAEILAAALDGWLQRDPRDEWRVYTEIHDGEFAIVVDADRVLDTYEIGILDAFVAGWNAADGGNHAI
jgi:hypothetical protein